MPVTTTDAALTHFRALAIQIRDARLLERRPDYYRAVIALNLSAFAAGWAILVIVGNSWSCLYVAAFLGIMFTQLAFLGHDAGHQQIFRSRRANQLLGLIVADGLIGLSFGWWLPKHNAHHAHPNQVGRDPDIGVGFVALNSSDGLVGEGGSIAQFLLRWQAWLFFPLMLLRTVGLHVSGTQRLFRSRDRAAVVEGVLLVVHSALYLTVLLLVLSPLKMLVFVVVQQSVFSLYLGLSFAPNHKGMPVIEGDPDMSFARRQVMTARNITGGRFVNFILGGLNYQTEHHLFPTMPRPNLARAHAMISTFCIQGDLGYCEDSLIGSYRRMFQHLAQTALTPSMREQVSSNGTT